MRNIDLIHEFENCSNHCNNSVHILIGVPEAKDYSTTALITSELCRTMSFILSTDYKRTDSLLLATMRVLKDCAKLASDIDYDCTKHVSTACAQAIDAYEEYFAHID